MTESGTMSRLLSLVTGTDAAVRRMERACFAINGEVSKLGQQTGANETKQMFTKDVSPYRMSILSDYAAGISTGGEGNRKAVTGYAAQPGKRQKEKKQNRTGLEDAVKAVTFFADNRNFLSSNIHRITAVTGTSTVIPGIFTEVRAAGTKEAGWQNKSPVEVTGGFDFSPYEFNDFALKEKSRAGYSDGGGFYGSSLKSSDLECSGVMGHGFYSAGLDEASGGRVNPEMVISSPAGAVKAADKEDIRWMRKLADRDYVAQVAHHTLAPNIKVEFTGPITKEADVDEIVSHLGALMKEQIAAAPEGVYG